MRSPLVMPRAGQKSLRRLVRRTERGPSRTSTLSTSRGRARAAAASAADVRVDRPGARRVVAGWRLRVTRGSAFFARARGGLIPLPGAPAAAAAAAGDELHAGPTSPQTPPR